MIEHSEPGNFSFYIYDYRLEDSRCQEWLEHTPPADLSEFNFYTSLLEAMVDQGHSTLEIVGLIPGLGILPDGINLIWYQIEGDVEGASWAALA